MVDLMRVVEQGSQIGHNRPDAHSPEPTLKGRLYSGTCRMAYGSNSVGTVESKDS
jgi:hypothetical protein